VDPAGAAPGWLVWVAAEGLFLVWTGSAWEVVGEPRDVSDASSAW
jgi:hypothetical protein